MRFPLLLLSVLFVLSACDRGVKTNPEAEAIEIDLQVHRFDKEFAEATPDDLPSLKAKYPFLFPVQTPDSLWIMKMQSDLQQEINTEVLDVFPDFDEESERIERFFKYVKHYFPETKIPSVYTLAEEVNYRQKLVLTDEVVLISLDNYLGQDHKFYQGLAKYIAFQQDKTFLISDLAEAFAKQKVNSKRSRTFLADMIYHGKLLYLKDLLMPYESDANKIYYSKDQWNWAENNETEVWSFFVERNLIYSTDNRLEERFINLGPYSKFYLELDNESSPRVGQYIGWQIVRAYMKKYPKTSLNELLELEADVIFKKSKYKPKS